MVNPAIDAEPLRKYAWDYFSIHAAQRMGAFQFFVTLSTAIVAGFLLLIRNTGGEKWMSVLGFLLAFISFVFFKLDIRTRGLVKNGERALRHLDGALKHQWPASEPHPLALFASDDASTEKNKAKIPFAGFFSYSRCFQYMFIGFGLLGLVSGICALHYFPARNASSEVKSDRPVLNVIFIDGSVRRRYEEVDS